MNPKQVHDLVQRHLRQRATANLLRARRIVEPIDAVRVRVDGRELVNFASNDYLGLAHHPRLLNALAACVSRVDGGCAGSGAAGLITGFSPVHAAAEAALARWKQTEAAILLPSGHQANLAAVQTYAAIGEAIGEAGARFLIDKLAHASLVDAIRATGQPFRIFPHNHLAKLERLLRESDPTQMQVVVTESIFSMDGDAADLPALAKLKEMYGFQLLLDEAHGSGVWGRDGAGYANACELAGVADVSVITCSKAMGLVGGAVCASRDFCSMLLQHGRAYIYSTNPPAFIGAGVEAALAIMRDEPARQQRVRALAGRVRAALSAAGLNLVGHPESPIIPVILGEESAALDAAARLEEAGILVVAVRPPTVPRGGSRLRVTVSCAHSDEQVDHLIATLAGGGA